MKALLLVLLLLVPGPAFAQATALDPDLAWSSHRALAQVVSDGTVVTAILLDSWASYHAEDPARAFTRQAIRTGVVVGASELVKRLVHRERPDRSDALSFWSEHTALSFSALGGPRWAIVVPLGVVTAEGRAGGAKHFLTDTIAGALVGGLAGRFLR